MSTVIERAPEKVPAASGASVIKRSWKVPIGLTIFAVIALVVFVMVHREGDATFRLASGSDFFALPDITLPGFVTCVVLTIVLCIMAAIATWLVWSRGLSRKRAVPLWFVIVFGIVFMFAFLVWADSGTGHSMTIPGLLLGTVALSSPLIFGAMAGVISERVGVVNIAIEGQMLAGACVSAFIGSVTHQWVLGLIAAMVAGVLVSFILATFAIKYLVDQVIVGVVVNVLVTGLTTFFYSSVLAHNSALNSPPNIPSFAIPVLSQIPIIGPVLFKQNLIVYLMYIAVAAVWWGLFKTKWGLRLRAVGEHPQAADTVGIRVNPTRFWNVSLAGAIAGLGGAYYSLGAVGSFQQQMTNGAGYIALAAVIFGRWDPLRATLAALLFGFASNLQSTLSAIGSPVPSNIMLMMPYVVTIIAVAGLVGAVRGPAASGKPYIKG